MNPTPLLISAGGETIPVDNTTFTLIDAMILIASSIIPTISGMYLLFFDSVEKSKSAIYEKSAGGVVLEDRKISGMDYQKHLKMMSR